jgi:endonuclease/exonuclease/phosphatase family metal-dependent hydrolase
MVSVLYVPANAAERQTYLDTFILLQPPLLSRAPRRHVILGDFNYSYAFNATSRNYRNAPEPWLDHIARNYHDSVHITNSLHQPTYHSGSARSCLDYIFISKDMSHAYQSS